MTWRSEEPGILGKLRGYLTQWLDQVRRAVFAPGRSRPDPTAVMAMQGAWQAYLDRFLGDLAGVAEQGWESLDAGPWVSVNSFVQAQLAITENLLVRLPDDVYNRVFAALSEGQAAGESTEQIAARIDAVLTLSGSEWWENRARVIAHTETHRAWMSGVLGAAQQFQPPSGRGWVKEWVSRDDAEVRPAHRRADGQTRAIMDTFTVGGESLLYPGDAAGLPGNVIYCRCDMIIKEA